jgi:N-acetyl-anhydromuramyl-L-alanine amidase AmpD
MREINKIIIHCSATKEGQDISAETIDEWHKARGWKGIGYHYVIGLDGIIEYGRPITETGAHVKNYNKGSIGICYIGGLDSVSKTAKDTRTPEQIATLLELLRVLKKLHPNATIHGHNEFSAKACPCFDAYNEYCNI